VESETTCEWEAIATYIPSERMVDRETWQHEVFIDVIIPCAL